MFLKAELYSIKMVNSTGENTSSGGDYQVGGGGGTYRSLASYRPRYHIAVSLLKTQFRRETSVGNCTLRNVKVFQKCIIYKCIITL